MATLVIASLLPTATASGQQLAFERDLRFVQDMVGDLHLFSLAFSELEQVRARYPGMPERQRIDELELELLMVHALHWPNDSDKIFVCQEALRRAANLLEASLGSPSHAAMRSAFSEGTRAYGAWLADTIEQSRGQDLEKVAALEREVVYWCGKGRAACEASMEEMSNRKEGDASGKAAFYVAWLRRAALLQVQARAVQSTRQALLEHAAADLGALILDVGENTLFGIQALFELAQIQSDGGEVAGACRLVVGRTMVLLEGYQEGSVDIPLEVVDELLKILAAAYERAARLHLAAGRFDMVLAAVSAYRADLKVLGLSLTDLENPTEKLADEDQYWGHLLYVANAQALARTGADLEGVLRLLGILSERHGGGVVGAQANRAMAEILDHAPRLQVPVARQLLVGAKGSYIAGAYERAIQRVRCVLAAPDLDPNSALEAWHLMGWSMMRQKRSLEAMLALQRGLEQHGVQAGQGLRRSVATSLLMAMRQVRLQTRDDPFFHDLTEQVGSLAVRHGATSGDGRLWGEAQQRLCERNPKGAVFSLRSIPSDSVLHEPAQLSIVGALIAQGDVHAARTAIADCRVGPHMVSSPPMCRMLDLLEARLAHEEAVATKSADGGQESHRRVVQLLANFEDRHGRELAGALPEVRFLLGRAYVATGDLGAAEVQCGKLGECEFSRDGAAALAVTIFGAFADQVARKSSAMIVAGGELSSPSSANKELNELRRRTAAWGVEAFRLEEQSNFPLAVTTLQMLKSMNEWSTIESFAAVLRTRFERDSGRQEDFDRDVLPLLGEALLWLGKIPQAYEVLSQAERADPSSFPIKRLICLALGGWTRSDGLGRFLRQPGLGRPADAYEKYASEYRMFGLNRDRGVMPFSLEWYEFHWECYFFAQAAAESHSRYEQEARDIYTVASKNGFDSLPKLGPRGVQLFYLFSGNRPPNPR